MPTKYCSAYTKLVSIQHYKENIMWKIVVGFVVFAAVALYLLSKGGDVDISGEKHGSMTFLQVNSIAS
jgi:hypothetical protein